MTDCFGRYYIYNGSLLQTESFDNSLVFEGDSFYEVIRLIRGVPVFFDDHTERLRVSLSLAGREMLTSAATLRDDIIKLYDAEKTEEINLKIVFNFKAEKISYLIYYIESVYPTESQYHNGVKGLLFTAERKDPAVKQIDMQLRSEIRSKLSSEGAYEAFLVNRNGCVTEGSRSNIFFITGNRLVTAPDDLVLSGIIRLHLIEICRENNILLEYKCVNVNEITEYESVFMTGTSPVVLPFYCIGDILFSVKHPLIGQLRKLCLKKADDSVRQFSLKQ